MGCCGQRPQTGSTREENIAEMGKQIALIGRDTEEAKEQLAKCATCLACVPRGYCSVLVQMGLVHVGLRDCQQRWDAWGERIMAGNCTDYINQERIMEATPNQVETVETPVVSLPTEPGLYWATVRFPVVVQHSPTLTLAQSFPTPPPSGYNALLCMFGPIAPIYTIVALQLPQSTKAPPAQWQAINYEWITAIGPNAEPPAK
jgi:hypothetical protein